MTKTPNHHNLSLEDLRFNPPDIPHDKLLEALSDIYGLTGAISHLEGERDQNVKIQTENGRQYVFKIAGILEDPSVVDFQVKALLHLERHAPNLQMPRLRPSLSGEMITRVRVPSGELHLARLVTWLDGLPFDKAPPPSKTTLQQAGHFLGCTASTLASFSHVAADHFMPWNIANGLVVSDSLWTTAGDDVRDIAAPLRILFQNKVLPTLTRMRFQIIHNDGHAGNVLRCSQSDETVCGLIDFGDMVNTAVVCDLAVAAAGFQFGGQDPMQVTLNMLKGYHAAMPLEDDEVLILPALVAMRKTLSLLMYDFRLARMESPPAFLVEVRPEMIDALTHLAKLDLEQAGQNLLTHLP